jgi:hypothetical protein
VAGLGAGLVGDLAGFMGVAVAEREPEQGPEHVTLALVLG